MRRSSSVQGRQRDPPSSALPAAAAPQRAARQAGEQHLHPPPVRAAVLPGRGGRQRGGVGGTHTSGTTLPTRLTPVPIPCPVSERLPRSRRGPAGWGSWLSAPTSAGTAQGHALHGERSGGGQSRCGGPSRHGPAIPVIPPYSPGAWLSEQERGRNRSPLHTAASCPGGSRVGCG